MSASVVGIEVLQLLNIFFNLKKSLQMFRCMYIRFAHQAVPILLNYMLFFKLAIFEYEQSTQSKARRKKNLNKWSQGLL